MKNFFLKLLFISLTLVGVQLIFPWWTALICAFLWNFLLKTKGWPAFFVSFIPAFFAWLIPSLMIHQETGNILTSKMATILPFAGNSLMLMLTSAFLIGLVTGLAGSTGNAFRDLFIKQKEKKRSGYHPAYRR